MGRFVAIILVLGVAAVLAWDAANRHWPALRDMIPHSAPVVEKKPIVVPDAPLKKSEVLAEVPLVKQPVAPAPKPVVCPPLPKPRPHVIKKKPVARPVYRAPPAPSYCVGILCSFFPHQ